jgi:hypothetical protein
MAIDEGRRNSQKNQNSRKLRKCYYHLYGQNRNAQKIKSLNPYTLLATNYTKSNGVRKGKKKSNVGKRPVPFDPMENASIENNNADVMIHDIL